MSHVFRRAGPALLALLLLAAGPLGATPQKPAPPPAPPALPAPPSPPAPPDIDLEPEDVDVEERGPALVTIFRHPHGYIGVRLLDLTPELRQFFSGTRDAGVLVSAVDGDTPAAKAGLLVGDVVTKVDGRAVSRASDVSRAVRKKEAGGKVALEVRREKANRTIEVTVAERKAERQEIRMPGFGPGFHFPDTEWDVRISGRVEEALERTREKLRQLEERLKELERRMKTK